MIHVECPSCHAPYEVDERRLPKTGLKMRCPKCDSTFTVTAEGVMTAPAAAAPQAPPAAPRAAKPTAPGLGAAGGPPAPQAPPAPPKPPAAPRKPTMAGLGDLEPPAAAPAAPPAAARRAPLAPTFPGADADLPAPKGAIPVPPGFDDLDLPAPKGAVPAPAAAKPAAGGLPGFDDFDLPAPKGAVPVAAQKPAAPAMPSFDDFDLPAPKGAVPAPQPPARPARAAVPSSDLDLPAPKGAVPAPPGFDDFDLPAPKGAVPAAKPAFDDFDLPAPKGAVPAAKPAFDDFDLPAPKGAVVAPPRLDDLDLPAPKGAVAPSFGDLDLPAPKAAKAGPPVLDLDLPAPKAAKGAPALGDLDLPAPKVGGASLDLDLPMAKPGGASFDRDLPAPKTGGASLDLDLPMPKGAGGIELDLPTPKGQGAMRTPFDDLDQGDVGTARDLDFDDLKHGGGGASLDLDLPPAKPARAAAPSLDLDLPPAKPAPRGPAPALGDLELPMPNAPGPSKGNVALDPLAELDLGRPAAPSAAKVSGGALFGASEAPPAPAMPTLEDDLALPSPRKREAAPGSPVTADGRAGAGGTGFGELDLGDEHVEEAEVGVEFGGIPTSEAPPSSGGMPDVHAPPPMVQEADRKAELGREDRKAQALTLKKKKFVRALVVTALTLTVVGGVGFALKETKYGVFGRFALEKYLPEAGTEASARAAITAAENGAKSDTYADVRAALRSLSEARAREGLNRLLLTRSVVHESLYQVRFGADPASSSRIGRILARLEERSNDAPGIELALAADNLRRGALEQAVQHVGTARAQASNDPYVDLVSGEIALAKGDGAAAATAFRAGLAHGGGARAQWGLARALRETHDAGALAAVDATLAASPGHIAARAAKADLVLAAGRPEEALGLAREAAGMVDVAGRRLRGSPVERAGALVTVGRIEESRNHRADARFAYQAACQLDPYSLVALVGAGRMLVEEGLFREALVRFQSALEQPEPRGLVAEGERPLLVQAKLGLVQALLRLDRPQEALETAQGLARDRADDPEALLALGNVQEALRQAAQAEATYRKVIEVAPTSFAGYLALAQFFFGQEKPDEAAQALALADGHVEVTAEVRRMKGESELRRNNLAAARAEFQGALELDANDRGALFGLGVTDRRDNHLNDALATFDRLQRLDASYPGLMLERGLVLEGLGYMDRAVEAYERALRANPEDSTLEIRLGAAQVVAGRLDAGERTLNAVLARTPNDPVAIHYLGRAAFQRGDYAAAEQRLAQAVTLDPQRAEYNVYLAWCRLDQNNIAAAREAVNSALAADPNSGDAHWVFARILSRTGQAADALVEGQRALELNPRRVEAWAVIGEAQEQLGNRSDAIAAFVRVTTAKPDVGEYWYKLGRVRIDAGQAGEGVSALIRAADLGDAMSKRPPWLADAHRLAGDGLRGRGDRAGAIRHYQRYLETAPAGGIDRAEVQQALIELGAPPAQ
ncbi:MAG: tetratricopeptide repeat protein [Polyangiales bacterium]